MYLIESYSFPINPPRTGSLFHSYYGPNYRSSILTANEGEDAALLFIAVANDAPLVVKIDNVKLDVETSMPVGIDIKPGSDDNVFNNNGHGVIPVAVLGSDVFDVTQIDVGTISLQGLEVKVAGKSNKYLYHYEDVNFDGYDDLDCQIEDTDTVFEQGDTIAEVKGNLNNGSNFHGQDNIKIVP